MCPNNKVLYNKTLIWFPSCALFEFLGLGIYVLITGYV